MDGGVTARAEKRKRRVDGGVTARAEKRERRVDNGVTACTEKRERRVNDGVTARTEKRERRVDDGVTARTEKRERRVDNGVTARAQTRERRVEGGRRGVTACRLRSARAQGWTIASPRALRRVSAGVTMRPTASSFVTWPATWVRLERTRYRRLSARLPHRTLTARHESAHADRCV